MLDRSRCLPIPLVLAGLGWLALIAAGFGRIHTYETTPALNSSLPMVWKPGSSLDLPHGRSAIAMAVHPRCPCTAASLRALARILEKSNGQTDVRLLVYRPVQADPSWAGTGWKEPLRMIRGIEYVDDPGGAAASRLGMTTSGSVVLFDAAGQLRFVGGLTAARGVEDDSVGVDLLRKVVSGGAASSTTCDVFGCPLAPTRIANQLPEVTSNE